MKKAGVDWDQTCFVGDDLFDLGALKRAGLSVSVADGLEEARGVADYVTRQPGGEGAIREIAEVILKAQGKWERIVEEQLK